MASRWRVTVEFSDAIKGMKLGGHTLIIQEALKGALPGCNVTVSEAMPVENSKVVVYTDGGCDKAGHKSPGAWAFVAEIPGRAAPFEMTGGTWETTNNQMELTAVLRALENLEIGVPILVVCDSEYVIKGCTDWGRKWRSNNWIAASTGKPVKNRDLWEPLLTLCDLHDVQFKHVPGHQGIPGNERVDVLCTQAMKALIEGELG